MKLHGVILVKTKNNFSESNRKNKNTKSKILGEDSRLLLLFGISNIKSGHLRALLFK